MIDLAGKSIKGYHIQEQVVVNAGEVGYRAVRTADEHPVWLRVMLPASFAHRSGATRRFERNFPLLTRLTHPHLVRAHEFWHDETGIYFVTDYMAGGDLRLYVMGKQRLPDADIHLILARMTAALDSLHPLGIIHQDIRPGVIRLDATRAAYLDVAGTVLERMIGDASSELVLSWMPVPWSISPEQAAAQSVDARTDIYALGVLLYGLLTGKNPFDATTPLQMILHHVRDPLPSLQAERPDLPPAVDALIQKATDKNPDRRYATAGEMFLAWQVAIAGLR